MPPKRFGIPALSTVEKLPDRLVLSREQPGIMRAPHWHAQVELNYVVRGWLDYRMRGHHVRIAAGDMALFWGGLPHRVTDTGEDSFYTAIHLPLFQFFRLRLSPLLQGRLMRGATVISAGSAGEDDAAFARWSATSRPAIRGARRTRWRRCCCGSSGSTSIRTGWSSRWQTRAAPSAASAAGFEPVKRMCDFMVGRFRERIDSVDIAVAADMHPKYAMSVFKEATGFTLGEYLGLLRLSFAQSLLVGGDGRSVLDAAMEAGFGSISAFNKSFRKVAGMTPSDFRRRHARPATGPARPPRRDDVAPHLPPRRRRGLH